MKESIMNTNWTLIKVSDKKIVVESDGQEAAHLDISSDDNAIYLDYAFVNPTFRGSGVGNFLVKESIQLLKQENKKLVPICGYVKALAEKNHLLR